MANTPDPQPHHIDVPLLVLLRDLRDPANLAWLKEWHAIPVGYTQDAARQIIDGLISEVERLRAENDALNRTLNEVAADAVASMRRTERGAS